MSHPWMYRPLSAIVASPSLLQQAIHRSLSIRSTVVCLLLSHMLQRSIRAFLSNSPCDPIQMQRLIILCLLVAVTVASSRMPLVASVVEYSPHMLLEENPVSNYLAQQVLRNNTNAYIVRSA